MDRVISLLQEKNHYLEKFYSINERQIIDLVDCQYEGLEAFYKNREKILEMIQYLDKQIDLESEKVKWMGVITDAQKQIIIREFDVKNQYVDKILDQDLRLISLVETAKSEIIGELNGIKQGKKVVSQYKSPVFKKQLDEKL